MVPKISNRMPKVPLFAPTQPRTRGSLLLVELARPARTGVLLQSVLVVSTRSISVVASESIVLDLYPKSVIGQISVIATQQQARSNKVGHHSENLVYKYHHRLGNKSESGA